MNATVVTINLPFAFNHFACRQMSAADEKNSNKDQVHFKAKACVRFFALFRPLALAFFLHLVAKLIAIEE